MLTIRTASLEDIENIQALDKAVFSPHEYNRRTIRQFFDMFSDYIFIAEYETQVCGYCLGSFSRNEAWVLALAVHPDFQSKGVGHALFNACISKMRIAEFPIIKLTVTPTNTNAIKIYRKAGFRDFELGQNYYSDGRVKLVMALEL